MTRGGRQGTKRTPPPSDLTGRTRSDGLDQSVRARSVGWTQQHGAVATARLTEVRDGEDHRLGRERAWNDEGRSRKRVRVRAAGTMQAGLRALPGAIVALPGAARGPSERESGLAREIRRPGNARQDHQEKPGPEPKAGSRAGPLHGRAACPRSRPAARRVPSPRLHRNPKPRREVVSFSVRTGPERAVHGERPARLPTERDQDDVVRPDVDT